MKTINKMSEIEMMVAEVVTLVKDGMYLVTAMHRVEIDWALDDEEFNQVYSVVNAIIYG